MTVEIGKLYRHFKGNLYQVLNIGRDCETGERVVVYQALYGTYEVFVRAYDSFTEMLDRNKYPNAAQLYRFVEVPRDSLGTGEQQQEKSGAMENVLKQDNGAIQAETPQYYEMASEKKQNIQTTPSYANTPEGTVAPVLVLFLEAEGSEAKYEVLKEHYLDIDDRTMTNIEVSLDVVSNAKELDERIRIVMDVLKTRAKYEDTRLR